LKISDEIFSPPTFLTYCCDGNSQQQFLLFIL